MTLFRICDVCGEVTKLDDLREVELAGGEHILVCPSCFFGRRG